MSLSKPSCLLLGLWDLSIKNFNRVLIGFLMILDMKKRFEAQKVLAPLSVFNTVRLFWKVYGENLTFVLIFLVGKKAKKF